MHLRLSTLSLALLLAGCGGGGSGDVANTSLPSHKISGQIQAQNVALDATVCIDSNQNFACDVGEISTQADSQGRYTLTSDSTQIYRFPIVADVSTGISVMTRSRQTSQSSILIAPALGKSSGNILNGVSSIFAGIMLDGNTEKEANRLLAEQLLQLGVEVNGDISQNFSHTALAILDANAVVLLQKAKASERIDLLATLGQTMAKNTPLIASEIVSGEKMTEYANTLMAQVSEERPLQDTGIIQFYSDQGAQARADADYPGQDAEYGLDITAKNGVTGKSFAFIKLDAAGNELEAEASDWSCVKDVYSGLIWEVKSEDAASLNYKERLFALEIADKFIPFAKDVTAASCQVAGDTICTTQDYINRINQDKLCGLQTWRLPTNSEQYMMLDLGEVGDDAVGFNKDYFPHQPQNTEFLDGHTWTSGIAYLNTSQFQSDGSMQYLYTALSGTTKGERSPIELYSSSTAADNDPSYVLPIRVVATKENNQ